MLYAIAVRGSTFSNFKNRSRVLQNSAIRAISNVNKFVHISPSYRKNNILKLDDLYKFEIAKLMFLHLKSLLPQQLQSFFVKLEDRLKYSTRNKSQLDLCLPNFKTSRLQRTFKHQGIIIWNNISLHLKQLSFSKFKSQYKELLIDFYEA